MKQWIIAARMLLILSILTGVIYPLAVTAIAQTLFPYQANGSLIVEGETVIGSELIGQYNDEPSYFWSRPSAVNYMQSESPDSLIASGGSNASYTNSNLIAAADERAEAFASANEMADDSAVPAEMLYASASGLDPHISPEAALLQVPRIAEARGLSIEALETLVAQYTEAPQLGIFGQSRVNVLLLNLALDNLE